MMLLCQGVRLVEAGMGWLFSRLRGYCVQTQALFTSSFSSALKKEGRFVCVYVCVCICVCVCVCVCAHVYMYVYVCIVCRYVHVCVYVCICVYVRMCVY